MSTPVPEDLVERLATFRRSHVLPLHVRALGESFASETLAVLFPHFAPFVLSSMDAVREDLVRLDESLRRIQRAIEPLQPGYPSGIPDRFFASLAGIHDALLDDADAIYHGDPAARSVDEVLLTYPGFYAIAVYRVAHALHELGMPLLPRLLTEHAHQKTGVDIHPAATIGSRFCIDHGTGVVVGETSVIGNRVKLYQGVTLGALNVSKDLCGKKRHPTIEDDVVIYAGATILGGLTIVGQSSIIGGNAWLTHSVPPFSLVTRRAEIQSRQEGDDPSLDFVI